MDALSWSEWLFGAYELRGLRCGRALRRKYTNCATILSRRVSDGAHPDWCGYGVPCCICSRWVQRLRFHRSRGYHASARSHTQAEPVRNDGARRSGFPHPAAQRWKNLRGRAAGANSHHQERPASDHTISRHRDESPERGRERTPERRVSPSVCDQSFPLRLFHHADKRRHPRRALYRAIGRRRGSCIVQADYYDRAFDAGQPQWWATPLRPRRDALCRTGRRRRRR